MCIEIGISVQRRAIQKLRFPRNENSFAVIMDLGIMKLVVQACLARLFKSNFQQQPLPGLEPVPPLGEAGLVGECCGPILIPFACTNIHKIIMILSNYQVHSICKGIGISPRYLYQTLLLEFFHRFP